MGLSVVHGIVKGHGGAVLVESRLNKGTSFHVYFPMLSDNDPPDFEIDNLLPIIGGCESILFVDDETTLVQLGKEMLERIGYDVVGRTNGHDALSLFRSRPNQFDIVITDLTMPNMTGIELAKNILKIRPEIPVIICTGFSEAVTVEEAREYGIRDLIFKPIVTRKIAISIRRALDRQSYYQ